jgi:ABC-type sugar transport system permease subunit
MAEQSTRFHGPETEEAFLADRMKFWEGFTSTTVWVVVLLILMLIGMGVFLL